MSKNFGLSNGKFDLYQHITDQIVEKLEVGTVPWIKPWQSALDRNLVTGHVYRGINTLLVWCSALDNNYKKPYWLTYKQAKDIGAQVRKGEKGTMICFWKMIETDKKDKNGDKKQIPLMRYYRIFNVEQCDDVPEKLLVKYESKKDNHTIDDCERFVVATEATIEYGGSKAAYIKTKDLIRIPELTSFDDSGNFYSTIFHELSHWTGLRERCDRQLSGMFGSHQYGVEELIAEMSSAFLCGYFQIQGELQHAEYINTWIETIKEDKKAIFKASKLAQQAFEYLLQKTGENGFSRDEDESNGDEV